MPVGVTAEEAPIVKLLNILILRAILERASDIHIEPTKESVRIRYRVDGLMHDVSSAPIYLHSSIVNRIKVMGRMDIAESRVPQDGRFELKTEDSLRLVVQSVDIQGVSPSENLTKSLEDLLGEDTVFIQF